VGRRRVATVSPPRLSSFLFFVDHVLAEFIDVVAMYCFFFFSLARPRLARVLLELQSPDTRPVAQ